MARRQIVTVVMPVYNGSSYMVDAIKSILEQTFCDFEFIIIDDGSTDRTSSIIDRFVDRRIVPVHQEHTGLVAALNRGVALAHGDYIAIMHADDISMPRRLEKQVDFLSCHSNIGILGTGYYLINAEGKQIGQIEPPPNDITIRWVSLFVTPFGHPTVMMRRQVLLDNNLGYSEEFDIDEDYDLWIRLLKHTRAASLSEPLLKYRVHSQSRTGIYSQSQAQQHEQIALRALREELPSFALTLEEHRWIHQELFEEIDVRPEYGAEKTYLAEVYFDMIVTFLRQRPDEPDLKALRHHEARRVSYYVLRHPGSPGWKRLAWHLFQMYPALPFVLCRDWLRFRAKHHSDRGMHDAT